MSNETNTNEVKYMVYKNDKRLRSASTLHVNKNIKMFSTNAAGVVSGKLESLRNEVKATKANIITIQETHSKKKGKNSHA